jgi:AraC family transcriptional regulator
MGRPALADYPRGARMAPRVIADFEFVWMLRGRAQLVTEGAEVDLIPGRLLLVPPGVRHGFVWDERAASRHGYVHFGTGYVPGSSRGMRLRSMTGRDPLNGLCEYLVWLGQDRPADWEDEARRTLRFLCDTFLADAFRPDAEERTWPRPMSSAIEILRREWEQTPLRRVGVTELATASNVSRSYLNRAFKRAVGLGVGAALERLRCARAETLLTRTNMTIGAIARQCGFADVYHFSHRFARVYGVSASAYRKGEASATSVLDDEGVSRLARAVWD